MKKTNHLNGHCENIKDLMSVITLRLWEQFTLNLSNFHDKIIKGEFVILPHWLQTKMRKSEVNQELQEMKQEAVGKSIFFQQSFSGYLFQNESINYL